MSDTPENSATHPANAKPGVSRRDFLNEITVGALGIAGLGGTALIYQYFSPNVLLGVRIKG